MKALKNLFTALLLVSSPIVFAMEVENLPFLPPLASNMEAAIDASIQSGANQSQAAPSAIQAEQTAPEASFLGQTSGLIARTFDPFQKYAWPQAADHNFGYKWRRRRAKYNVAYNCTKTGVALALTLFAAGVTTKLAFKLVKWAYGTKAAVKVKSLLRRNKAEIEACEAKVDACEADNMANAKPAPRVQQEKAKARIAVGWQPNRNAAHGKCTNGRCGR